jgi:hypothetical protein
MEEHSVLPTEVLANTNSIPQFLGVSIILSALILSTHWTSKSN